METNLLPNVQGNVQALRNMWTNKVEQEKKSPKLRATVYRSGARIIENEPIIKKKPMVTFNHVESMEISSVIDEMEDSSSLSSTLPSVGFKQQTQSIITLKQSMTKMFDVEKKIKKNPNGKSPGNRHWHIARHVFRSGLIFGPTRRASDSIVPLLMKTHLAHNRSHTDSLDSTPTETPLENLIDYISRQHHHDEHLNVIQDKSFLKRTISDSSACIQRNKLDDTIAQYEMIMRHLKNYDKFMTDHPQTTSKPIEDNIQLLSKKNSIQTRQTQSLARNAGRTFTEFIMNDLLSSQSNEKGRSTTVHASSQTDLNELIKKIDSIPIEDTKTALNELDQAIHSVVIQDPPITPNSEINVIIVNSPMGSEPLLKKDKPLIQRLFEEQKTAYTSMDLQMKSIRIPEELTNTFETAKTKCLFPEEQLLYATKMVKIDRRGYKQHIRILCLTNERLYIITKRKSYAKEALLLKDILGITCTPYRDGFICLHTRETREDRGDWIFVVDHPCEFITQLFMSLGKINNNDNFLNIKTKFQHTRRNIAQVADECTIEVRSSEKFYLAYENYDILVIYTP